MDIFNFSNRLFKDEELIVLERGPKYIFSTKPNLKSNIQELESIVQSSHNRNKEGIRNIKYHEFNKLIKQPTGLSDDELNTLKNFGVYPEIQTLLIILIQTDKYNKLAILNTYDFKRKMRKCINYMNCIEAKKNPLKIIFFKVLNYLIKLDSLMI